MRKQTKKWTPMDGVKIRICDMRDFHLISTLKLLIRKAEARRIYFINVYTCGPYPQGEMAQDCFDSEYDRILESTYEDYVPEIFYNLYDDFLRRDLDTKLIDDYEQAITKRGFATEVGLISKRLKK